MPVVASPSQEPKKIFVYGSLKTGEDNNGLMTFAGGKFICNARTLTEYPLVTELFPYLLPFPSYGYHVTGELWELPASAVVRYLDSLEGHPDMYRRQPVAVLPLSLPLLPFNVVVAEAYFFQHKFPELLELPRIKWWTRKGTPEPIKS